jgi:hypothetical protein
MSVRNQEPLSAETVNCPIVRLIPAFLVLGWIVIAVPAPELAFEFDWFRFALDLLHLGLTVFVLPLTLPKACYVGNLFNANFSPIKTSWPVWVFWVGLYSVAAHFGGLIKRLVGDGCIDYYYGVRIAMISFCLWAVFTGKVKRWRSQSPN